MNNNVNGKQTVIKGIEQQILFNKSKQQTLINGIAWKILLNNNL